MKNKPFGPPFLAALFLFPILSAACLGNAPDNQAFIVPAPGIGDKVVYRTAMEGGSAAILHSLSSNFGYSIRFDPDTAQPLDSSTYRVVALGPGDTATVTVEESIPRWDSFQWEHPAIALNWTWNRQNLTFPFVTEYVSHGAFELLSIAKATWGGGPYMIWAGERFPTTLGASIFWQENLVAGREFSVDVSDADPRSLQINLDRIKLRFSIRPDDVGTPDLTLRATLNNPEAFSRPEFGYELQALKIWFSIGIPFPIMYEATWDWNGDEEPPHTARFEMADFRKGNTLDGPMADDLGPRVHEPAMVNPIAWDGYRFPGDGEAFASFPASQALQILERNEPNFKIFRVLYGPLQIASEEYQSTESGSTWSFVFRSEGKKMAAEGRVTFDPSGRSLLPLGTSSQFDTSWEEKQANEAWVSPKRDQLLIDLDDCWSLWSTLVGSAPLSPMKIRYEWNEVLEPMCDVLIPDPSYEGVLLGLFFSIHGRGALLGYSRLPEWLRH